jgi:hypothetical protein
MHFKHYTQVTLYTCILLKAMFYVCIFLKVKYIFNCLVKKISNLLCGVKARHSLICFIHCNRTSAYIKQFTKLLLCKICLFSQFCNVIIQKYHIQFNIMFTFTTIIAQIFLLSICFKIFFLLVLQYLTYCDIIFTGGEFYV